MSEFKIEKGIPICPRRSRGRPLKYPFANMKVGDSLLIIEGGNKRSIYNSAKKYGKKNGVEFAGRTVDGGYRIWRIK